MAGEMFEDYNCCKCGKVYQDYFFSESKERICPKCQEEKDGWRGID